MATPPRAADLLISGGFVLTMDRRRTTFYPGTVAVRDRRILAVGLSTEIDATFAAPRHIDARDHVILPGLINIHGHASNSLIRGLGSHLQLHEWLEQVCWPCMGNAADEDLYNGVLLSCLEMLGNGVTTFADMWVGVGEAATAVARSGQRAMLAHNIKDFGDPARGQAELGAALDAWQRWHGHANGRVNVGLGPHSVYTCQPALLADCARHARENKIHVQIHGSETEREVREARAVFRRTPIELMDEVGLLGEMTVVAHAVHLEASDVKRLRASGSAVAHNIASNLKLASGIAPIYRYLDAGICVGLGTDGPGSNDSLDLLRDLKMAALIQKAVAADATCLLPDAALAMVTCDAARALGLDAEIGSLEAGKRADIILFDLDRPHLTPHHPAYETNIPSHLVYSASGADVTTVLVDGQLLMHDGAYLTLDPAAVRVAAQTSSERILHRSGLL